MKWKDLSALWQAIKKGDTPGWDDGKALEYLVVRAFELNRIRVEYPYHVPPGGDPIEQIDGMVILDGSAYLLECKDTTSVDIVPVTKLVNQLIRRPQTTCGSVFTSGAFSTPATILADLSLPHRILFWSGIDVESALTAKDFASALREKYYRLCKFGLTDYSPHYRELEV
jgi:hypothetical protein